MGIAKDGDVEDREAKSDAIHDRINTMLAPFENDRRRRILQYVFMILAYVAALRENAESLDVRHLPTIRSVLALHDDIMLIHLDRLGLLLVPVQGYLRRGLSGGLVDSMYNTFRMISEMFPEDSLEAEVYRELASIARESLENFVNMCRATTSDIRNVERIAEAEGLLQSYIAEYTRYPGE